MKLLFVVSNSKLNKTFSSYYGIFMGSYCEWEGRETERYLRKGKSIKRKRRREKNAKLIIKNGCACFGCGGKRSHWTQCYVCYMLCGFNTPTNQRTNDLLSICFAIQNSCKSKSQSMSVEWLWCHTAAQQQHQQQSTHTFSPSASPRSSFLLDCHDDTRTECPRTCLIHFKSTAVHDQNKFYF